MDSQLKLTLSKADGLNAIDNFEGFNEIVLFLQEKFGHVGIVVKSYISQPQSLHY